MCFWIKYTGFEPQVIGRILKKLWIMLIRYKYKGKLNRNKLILTWFNPYENNIYAKNIW